MKKRFSQALGNEKGMEEGEPKKKIKGNNEAFPSNSKNEPKEERNPEQIVIKGNKTDKKLERLYKGKAPCDVLPTHENEIVGTVNDFKITYLIRQAVKSGNIINCNTLLSQVFFFIKL